MTLTVLIQNIIFDIYLLFQKLKTTACCLTSASLSATEATEWARLITALAEARKAVKNM
jgi:hypothetical protein